MLTRAGQELHLGPYHPRGEIKSAAILVSAKSRHAGRPAGLVGRWAGRRPAAAPMAPLHAGPPGRAPFHTQKREIKSVGSRSGGGKPNSMPTRAEKGGLDGAPAPGLPHPRVTMLDASPNPSSRGCPRPSNTSDAAGWCPPAAQPGTLLLPPAVKASSFPQGLL